MKRTFITTKNYKMKEERVEEEEIHTFVNYQDIKSAWIIMREKLCIFFILTTSFILASFDRINSYNKNKLNKDRGWRKKYRVKGAFKSKLLSFWFLLNLFLFSNKISVFLTKSGIYFKLCYQSWALWTEFSELTVLEMKSMILMRN